jgi:hypothetical protein
MSREEHLRELVQQGQALRQEDIDLGAKQERERILELLESRVDVVQELTYAIELIQGEN